MEYLWTAFTIGLFGSLHCVGMCGPIALALPVVGDSPTTRIAGRLLYNFGRIVTYAVLGLLFGILGRAVDIAGAQQGLSLILGILLIAAVILPQRWRRALLPRIDLLPGVGRLRAAVARLFRLRSMSALALIGLLNGLLPCGFVYFGIAGAVLAGTPGNGALYMALFGLGTLPMMLATSLAGNAFGAAARKQLLRMVPVFAIAIGALFVLRGLALDIPYISPADSSLQLGAEECCH